MKKERKEKHFIQKPVYPGGLKAMRVFIKENLQYPKEALELRKEGTVKLRYDINYKGKVIDVMVLSGMGFGCDEEAIRIVKLFKFEVGKIRKGKVKFHKDIQIYFRLPKVKKVKLKPTPKPKIEKVFYNYVTTSKTELKTDNQEKKSQQNYSYKLIIKK